LFKTSIIYARLRYFYFQWNL